MMWCAERQAEELRVYFGPADDIKALCGLIPQKANKEGFMAEVQDFVIKDVELVCSLRNAADIVIPDSVARIRGADL